MGCRITVHIFKNFQISLLAIEDCTLIDINSKKSITVIGQF